MQSKLRKFRLAGLYPRTLFTRIAIVFAVLFIALAAILMGLGSQLWFSAYLRQAQLDQWHVASDLARLFEAEMHGRPASEAYQRLQEAALSFQRHHPSADIYLLDQTGKVQIEMNREPAQLVLERVPLEPIRKFLADNARTGLPHLGPDLAKAGQSAVFSVAPCVALGEPGYVYVTVLNSRSDAVLSLLLEDAFFRLLLLYALLAVAALLLLGRWALRALAGRFARIGQAIERYEHGDLSEAIVDEGNDELGDVTRGVNRMIGAIKSYVGELQQKDQLRRELIMDIWHDLRAPVTAIRGNIELLMERSEAYSAERRAACYRSLEKSTELLNALINELQELASLEAKEARPNIRKIDAAAAAREVVASLQERAEASGVLLEVAAAENECLAWADDAMISRVLLNLIDNALRHSPAGSRVQVLIETAGDCLRLSVRDNGHGIPEEALPRLFERSFQHRDGKAQVGSAGLGLAIVKRILEAHDSTIHVQSVPEQGTTFSFELAAA